MECKKCKGLMIEEPYSDYFLVCHGWKCLNCGEIVDPIIIKNRTRSSTAVMMAEPEALTA
jgi:hypothetical protein